MWAFEPQGYLYVIKTIERRDNPKQSLVGKLKEKEIISFLEAVIQSGRLRRVTISRGIHPWVRHSSGTTRQIIWQVIGLSTVGKGGGHTRWSCSERHASRDPNCNFHREDLAASTERSALNRSPRMESKRQGILYIGSETTLRVFP